MPHSTMSSEEIRALIVKVAEEEFLAQGIRNTEMKDIAFKCNISRTTLYRYFARKEQLAFLVAGNIVCNMIFPTLTSAVDNSLSGYENLERFAYNYIHLLIQNTEQLSFLAEFDKLFEQEYPSVPEAELYIQTIKMRNNEIAEVISKGQKDGSITSPESPALIASVLTSSILGVGQRVLRRSAHFQVEHGVSGAQILIKSVEYVLNALR